jgi:hypothetical protein
MRTSIEEIRKRSRKQIESEATGITYTIKKLCQIDFSSAGISGFIALGPAITMPEQNSPEEIQIRLRCIRYVIEHGVDEPRVFTGPDNETPDNAVHISWITEDTVWLQEQILAFSGLNPENQKQLEEYAKKKIESPSSMLLPNGMESDPVLS